MEEFVAVRPLKDFQITATNAFTSTLREWDPLSLSRLLDSVEEGGSSVYSKLLSSIKQEALLFDKIYIIEDLERDRDLSKNLITELEWLAERNIIAFVSLTDVLATLETEEIREYFRGLYELTSETMYEKHKKLTAQTRKKLHRLEEEMQQYIDATLKRKKGTTTDNEKSEQNISEIETRIEKLRATMQQWLNVYEKYAASDFKNMYPLADVLTRTYALQLEYSEKVMVTPMLSYTSYLHKVPILHRSNVAQIVVHDIPLPDPNTAWERIIEYRENHDNRNSLLALRRWIRKISEENLSMVECKQELDWLKSEFQAHLRLHKIKANNETLEAIIKAPLEILENLVKFKFSKLPDPLFAIKKRQISLMEAELNAPGREIAYLIKSKQSFE